MPRIFSVKPVVVYITFPVDFRFPVTFAAYLPAHIDEASGIAFAAASHIHLRRAVASISFQDTLDEGQFFFGVSVRAAMRLSFILVFVCQK